MGAQQVEAIADDEALRAFTVELARDLARLDALVSDGAIESGVRRVGAEQEAFLVDRAWRAVPAIAAVLARVGDPNIVPEIGAFQAEVNLVPVALEGVALARLHAALDGHLAQLRRAARAVGAELVLTGILPTLRRVDATPANLTARPRYAALNDATSRLRSENGDQYLRIEGVDELLLRDGSAMFEAATASFQVHLQVGVAEFARFYNAAQAAAGPQLAAAANSPLLFGQRLWHETRVPLFQQAADTRTVAREPSHRTPRVTFGTDWVHASPVEVFREDVARFPALLVARGGDAASADAGPPALAALRVHTGTVYRWNRVCYGVLEGRPHLRIENRVLPSGPTTLDEVANAAFWLGLVAGLARAYGDVARRMAFDDAKANFFAAARDGLDAHVTWLDGTDGCARDLILARLLPLAREGLATLGVDRYDATYYLDVLRARVDSRQTGARWLLASDAAMRAHGSRGEQLAALTAATVARQQVGAPVHEWSLARLDEAGGPPVVWSEVERVMETDVPTVRDADALALVESVMDWRDDQHVPVEDAAGAIVGLVSRRAVADALPARAAATVAEVMDRDVVRVEPETPLTETLAAMRAHAADCALVVRDGRLVGLITARTLATAARVGR